MTERAHLAGEYIKLFSLLDSKFNNYPLLDQILYIETSVYKITEITSRGYQ